MDGTNSSEDQELHESYSVPYGAKQGRMNIGNHVLGGRRPSSRGSEGRRLSNYDGCSTPGSWYYSVDHSVSASGYNTPTSDLSYKHDVIRRSYMRGQIAEMMNRSLWWSVMGILIPYFADDYYMIPECHITLNLSFLFSSLFSDLLAEAMTMRTLLCLSVVSRMILWIIAFPVCYLLLSSYARQLSLVTFSFLVVMVLDGFQEALSKASDIARKGLDRLSHSYHLIITPEMHNQMNKICQLATGTSTVLLVLPLAATACVIKYLTDQSDLLILVAVIGSAIFVLSAISLCSYAVGLRNSITLNGMIYNEGLEISISSLCNEIVTKLGDITNGMMLAKSAGHLFKQITFLTMETAFQHSMICFIIPITAFGNSSIRESDLLYTTLICALLLSAEKLGGLFCGLYVAYGSPFNDHDSTSTYRTSCTIYRCLVLATISLALLPLCSLAPDSFVYGVLSSPGGMCVLVFCFSAFSSYPKAVISSCMHMAVLSHPLSYKIFDFIGVMLVIWDIILTFAIAVFMNRIFGYIDVNVAYITIALFYVLHASYHIFTGVGLNSLTMEQGILPSHVAMWTPLNSL